MSIWNPCARRGDGTTSGASSVPAGKPPSSGPFPKGRPYAPGTAISAASIVTAARQADAERTNPFFFMGRFRREAPHILSLCAACGRKGSPFPAQAFALQSSQPRRGRFFCLPRAMPISLSGISLVMTEPAPTSASAPTRTGATSAVLLPMKARSPMRVWNLFLPS